MPGCAKTGKKLPNTLAETLALWKNERPLRLMFQDEVRASDASAIRAIVGAAALFVQGSSRWSRSSIAMPMAQSARWMGISIA